MTSYTRKLHAKDPAKARAIRYGKSTMLAEFSLPSHRSPTWNEIQRNKELFEQAKARNEQPIGMNSADTYGWKDGLTARKVTRRED